MANYKERNWGNIAKLADNTKKAATALLKWAESENIEVLIYETIRTKAQQAENVKKGASQTMKSYHLTGQALDFVPAKGSAVQWDGYGRADIKKFIAKAKALGFEWGGEWKGFIDKPHLQFNYKGYGSDTFNGKGTTGTTGAATNQTPKPATNGGALGLVDYLNSKKIDSSFANRKKLAAKHGVLNYTGTAAQNTALLAKLKGTTTQTSTPQSAKPSTATPKKKADRQFNEKGVYTAKTTVAIKYEPKVKASQVAKLTKGEKVHYSRVAFSDGYVWVQYLRSNGRKAWACAGKASADNSKNAEAYGTFK